jgi:hypothetical protein
VQRSLDCYYPGKGFPSVSTTGGSCALRCKHCAGRYLEGMVPVTEPEELLEFARALADSGGSGFLISGGCDAEGRVRLERFAPAMKEIKSSTALRVNAHVGLTPRGGLEALFDSGVDMFSVDVYGDDETVAEVLGIPAKAADYASVVSHLTRMGARVAPHVCIGIRGGEIGHERAAIDMVAPMAPEALVLISFIPTKGTEYASRRPPAGEEVVSLVSYARARLPRTRLLLGCMRSKRDRSWEFDAVRAGLDGIVLPAEETVRAAAALGYVVRKKSSCCALG